MHKPGPDTLSGRWSLNIPVHPAALDAPSRASLGPASTALLPVPSEPFRRIRRRRRLVRTLCKVCAAGFGILKDTRGGGFTISDFMKSEILLSHQFNNFLDPHRRVQR
jgi:hypothetical protein